MTSTLFGRIGVPAFLPLLVWCSEKPKPTGALDIDPDSATEKLACVAPMLVRSCAMAGWHDAETRQHGMDLSTGDRIYDSLVDRVGLDHCTSSAKIAIDGTMRRRQHSGISPRRISRRLLGSDSSGVSIVRDDLAIRELQDHREAATCSTGARDPGHLSTHDIDSRSLIMPCIESSISPVWVLHSERAASKSSTDHITVLCSDIMEWMSSTARDM
jgi:hypothetical protein